MSDISNQKKVLLHTNYKRNFELFNAAMGDNHQIECLIIIFAVLEQVTSNMIVRLASIDEGAYEFFKDNLPGNPIVNLSRKVKALKKFYNRTKVDSLSFLKTDSDRIELLEALRQIDTYRKPRNDIVHYLMQSTIEYDELKKINLELREDFNVLNKNLARIKSFIKKNGISKDVGDLSKLLENAIES